ncbi:MAG: D-alanyl-D-alanine carboxypeptidase family protein [Lachnospiraceae bacterium]
MSCPAVRCQLTEAFADTAEGRWLARNAPLYGFILRYPRGKDEITGYAWELLAYPACGRVPWPCTWLSPA